MEGIQFLQALPYKIAIAESALTYPPAIAQRADKAAEYKEECDTTVTTCIKPTDVAIVKVRHEDHHHKDEAQ